MDARTRKQLISAFQTWTEAKGRIPPKPADAVLFFLDVVSETRPVVCDAKTLMDILVKAKVIKRGKLSAPV